MERNKPFETFQPVKEDNLFKQTIYSGNFPVGSTKNVWNLCVNGKQPLYFDSKLTNVIPQTFRPLVKILKLQGRHFVLSY